MCGCGRGGEKKECVSVWVCEWGRRGEEVCECGGEEGCGAIKNEHGTAFQGLAGV